MADNKKQQRKKITSEVKALFGNDIPQELRQLIDLAVRKQLTSQDVVERLVNTHYFRRQFPGIIEHNGSIANALTGEQGAEVSVSSLGSAIKNYRTALNDFSDISSKYGVNFNKNMLAQALKSQTSAQEYATRLQAIDTVDSNPAALQAFEQQMRMNGYKVNKDTAYRAAAGAGDKKFLDIYEASRYQAGLGLNKQDAAALVKHGGAAPGGATFQSIDQVVQAARQNIQTLGPELAAQGIGIPKLVKILNNPSANPAEMDIIQQALEARKGLFGQPVQGTYAQRGQNSGGFSVYDQQQEQAYG